MSLFSKHTRVIVNGGLGNQMFCYSMSEYLKSKGIDCRFEWRDLLYTTLHYGMELTSAFRIGFSDKEMKKIRRYVWINNHSNAFAKTLLGKAVHLYYKCIGVYHQPNPYCFIRLEDLKLGGILYGAWQNYEYVEPVLDILSSRFQFNLPANDKILSDIVSKIERPDSVSIHIRRGDYSKYPKLQPFDMKDYVNRAIGKYLENIPGAHFYVFSDGPEWCRENIGYDDYEIIDDFRGDHSYLNMYVLSRCPNLIISNSTFSWWAAVINHSPDKKVIAPSVWFDGIESKQFCPSGWSFI